MLKKAKYDAYCNFLPSSPRIVRALIKKTRKDKNQ